MAQNAPYIPRFEMERDTNDSAREWIEKEGEKRNEKRCVLSRTKNEMALQKETVRKQQEEQTENKKKTKINKWINKYQGCNERYHDS